MAKFRRVITKVERARQFGFDEQLWPVNLALLVLAGFVAGIIIVQGGWDDPRLLHNGWVRLMTLGANSGGELRPVPTAVPPSASSARRGLTASSRASPFFTCCA